MYNLKKLEGAKKILWAVVIVFTLLFGVVIGTGIGSKQEAKKQTKQVKQEVKQPIEKNLSETTVNQFLISYYTKENLGENQSRYKPLVTTPMFNELTADEEQPVNQAFKDYLVNQVFDYADIYINQTDLTVICKVTYHYTKRTVKGSDNGALMNQNGEETIQLTFEKQGKEFLVSRLEYLQVSTPISKPQNDFKTTLEIEELAESTEEKAAILNSEVTETNETTDQTTQESGSEK